MTKERQQCLIDDIEEQSLILKKYEIKYNVVPVKKLLQFQEQELQEVKETLLDQVYCI